MIENIRMAREQTAILQECDTGSFGALSTWSKGKA
jgi:hypothetical protein